MRTYGGPARSRIGKDQWQREDAQRWLQDRQQAYARLMAALDEWDVAVNQGMARRHTDALTGERSEYDPAEWKELRQAARAAQGLVELMAPESVRGRASPCWQGRRCSRCRVAMRRLPADQRQRREPPPGCAHR